MIVAELAVEVLSRLLGSGWVHVRRPVEMQPILYPWPEQKQAVPVRPAAHLSSGNQGTIVTLRWKQHEGGIAEAWLFKPGVRDLPEYCEGVLSRQRAVTCYLGEKGEKKEAAKRCWKVFFS